MDKAPEDLITDPIEKFGLNENEAFQMVKEDVYDYFDEQEIEDNMKDSIALFYWQSITVSSLAWDIAHLKDVDKDRLVELTEEYAETKDEGHLIEDDGPGKFIMSYVKDNEFKNKTIEKDGEEIVVKDANMTNDWREAMGGILEELNEKDYDHLDDRALACSILYVGSAITPVPYHAVRQKDIMDYFKFKDLSMEQIIDAHVFLKNNVAYCKFEDMDQRGIMSHVDLITDVNDIEMTDKLFRQVLRRFFSLDDKHHYKVDPKGVAGALVYDKDEHVAKDLAIQCQKGVVKRVYENIQEFLEE